MDKEDVKKDHKVNEETWSVEELMFGVDVASDYNPDDVPEVGESEVDLNLISFDEDEDFSDLAKDEAVQEEDLVSEGDFRGYIKPKKTLVGDMGQKFIHRSEYNSIDEDKVFEPSDKSFHSKDPDETKFLSFVCECNAKDVEKYIKAICCYINNVGGRSLYTRVVSSGYPGLYLLFVSLYAPFDAPFVDCFDEKLKAAVK